MVLVFAICWAPFHIDRLLWSFITEWTDYMHNVFEYVHILSGVLFYLSSAVNPIIYNLLSSRFRERFFELMCSGSDGNTSRNSSPPSCKRASFPKGSAAILPKTQTAAADPTGHHPSVIFNRTWEQELKTTLMWQITAWFWYSLKYDVLKITYLLPFAPSDKAFTGINFSDFTCA